MSMTSFRDQYGKMVEGSPWEDHANQKHELGFQVHTPDGRKFRYAKVGASTISPGKLQLAPAPKTNHHNIAVAAAAAIGATQVTVTLGATAAVANEYAEGTLVVSDATGEGYEYKIKSHPAADSSGSLVVTLEDPIQVALTTSSEVCLVHNVWNGVVEGTSSTQRPAGVAKKSVTTGRYCWLQTGGISAGLADETITLGAGITAGTSTAGAFEEVDQPGDTTVLTDYQVGWAIVAGVDTEYRPVFLTID